MWTCKHCNSQFSYNRNTEKANHSRHCDSNPKKLASYANLKDASKRRFDSSLGEFKKYDVSCITCNNCFQVEERENQHPTKTHYYCSRKCANSVGGKAKVAKHHTDDNPSSHYRTIAWRHHEKKCVICDEDRVVAVHHLNEDHKDNRPENLIPLCPTHHQYVHSKYKEVIQGKIDAYLTNKWG